MPPVLPVSLLIVLFLVSILGFAVGTIVFGYLSRRLVRLAASPASRKHRIAVTISICVTSVVAAITLSIFSDVLVLSNVAIYLAIPLFLVSLFTLRLWQSK